jgi:hypothetical protein
MHVWCLTIHNGGGFDRQRGGATWLRPNCENNNKCSFRERERERERERALTFLKSRSGRATSELRVVFQKIEGENKL